MKTEMVSKLQERFKKHFQGTKWPEINEYFNFDSKDKLFCEYCGIKLKARPDPPYYESVSLDHKVPKARGGYNTFQNIAICCHQCNIVKGTMLDVTFKTFHELLDADPHWKKQIFDEIFLGRKANKINRLFGKKDEKPKKRYLHEFM